ncbi:MAG: ADP-ribosylglycohydrolase family protein [Clostridiales Family XIII bacterium]|jgi:ADP-ribosylglycohydrolase|nr:ADP-ribosylglycohydrolase family protein [Clostridiales Family XIII bacterium]
MNKLDKEHFRGCLLGGSIADAKGFSEVQDRVNLVSDNTQLTSFTLDGLVWADEKAVKRGIYAYIPCLFYSYQKWYYTQTGSLADEAYKFILNGEILKWEDLFARRGKGTTTLYALKDSIHNRFGSLKHKVNNGIGCGAVMRSAPIGMYFANDEEAAFNYGVQAAALTHGSDNAILSPGFFAYLIALIFQGMDINEAAIKSLSRLSKNCFSLDVSTLHDLIKKAILLSKDLANPIESLNFIGKGDIAEEAMADALYIALKYYDDFNGALKVISQYDGNKSSIGSIAGNLIGANIGINNLPFDLIYWTELSDLIVYGADKLLDKVLYGVQSLGE